METKNKLNDGLVLLPKIILQPWNCFLLSVAADGRDGNRLKLDKTSQFFQVLKLGHEKSQNKYDSLLALLNSYAILCTSEDIKQWY